MYQIKWNEVIPQLLPKLIDRRVVKAHGSYFDCQFTLDLDDKSSVQFKCDDLTYRNAIEFEIILNRQKMYVESHSDSTDVITNNLGKIVEAIEYRTEKRKNAREVILLFDAHKKHFSFSQLILSQTKFTQYALNQTITDEIASFLYPRNDKMTIRAFRKEYALQRQQSAESIKMKKHEEMIKELYNTQGKRNNEVNYDNSVFDLYPIQSNQLTLEQTRNGGDNITVDSLYPIGNIQNEENENTNHSSDHLCRNKIETKLMKKDGKKKEYEKVYCDVVCVVSSWLTYTATAKKQKH